MSSKNGSSNKSNGPRRKGSDSMRVRKDAAKDSLEAVEREMTTVNTTLNTFVGGKQRSWMWSGEPPIPTSGSGGGPIPQVPPTKPKTAQAIRRSSIKIPSLDRDSGNRHILATVEFGQPTPTTAPSSLSPEMRSSGLPLRHRTASITVDNLLPSPAPSDTVSVADRREDDEDTTSTAVVLDQSSSLPSAAERMTISDLREELRSGARELGNSQGGGGYRNNLENADVPANARERPSPRSMQNTTLEMPTQRPQPIRIPQPMPPPNPETTAQPPSFKRTWQSTNLQQLDGDPKRRQIACLHAPTSNQRASTSINARSPSISQTRAPILPSTGSPQFRNQTITAPLISSGPQSPGHQNQFQPLTGPQSPCAPMARSPYMPLQNTSSAVYHPPQPQSPRQNLPPNLQQPSRLPLQSNDSQHQQPLSKLSNCLVPFDEHVAHEGGPKFSNFNSVESFRYRILREALVQDDWFYVLLHQVYSLLSLNPKMLFERTRFTAETCPGFSIMPALIEDNSRLSLRTLKLFSEFPSPFGTPLTQQMHYQKILARVKAFLCEGYKALEMLQNYSRQHRLVPSLEQIRDFAKIASPMLRQQITAHLHDHVEQVKVQLQQQRKQQIQQQNAVIVQQRLSLMQSNPEAFEKLQRSLVGNQHVIGNQTNLSPQGVSPPQQSPTSQTFQIQQPSHEQEFSGFYSVPQSSQQQPAIHPASRRNSSVDNGQINYQMPNGPYMNTSGIQPTMTTQVPTNAASFVHLPTSAGTYMASTTSAVAPATRIHPQTSNNPFSGAVSGAPQQKDVHQRQAQIQTGPQLSILAPFPQSNTLLHRRGSTANAAGPVLRASTQNPAGHQMVAPGGAVTPTQFGVNMVPRTGQFIPQYTRSQCSQPSALFPSPSNSPRANQQLPEGLFNPYVNSPGFPPSPVQKSIPAPKLYISIIDFAFRNLIITPEKPCQKWNWVVDEDKNNRLSKLKSCNSGEAPKRPMVQAGFLIYRLRCIKISKSDKIPETDADWVLKETTWPENIFIEVNTQRVEIPRKIQWGKDQPADITTLLQAGENELKIVILGNRKALDSPKYVMAVEVFECQDEPTISDELTKNRRIEPSEAKSMILSRFSKKSEEDDIMLVDSGEILLSVYCPLSFTQLKTPVRGKSCRHSECFDFTNFMATRLRRKEWEPPHADSWKCPICGGDARPGELVIDGFLADVLGGLKDRIDIKHVVVRADGTWDVKREEDQEEAGKNKTPVEIICIDDDDD